MSVFARQPGWMFVVLTVGATLRADHAAHAQVTPAGLWNTISDVDGKPTAVVEIREVNGEYVGIVRALLVAADLQDSVCVVSARGTGRDNAALVWKSSVTCGGTAMNGVAARFSMRRTAELTGQG